MRRKRSAKRYGAWVLAVACVFAPSRSFAGAFVGSWREYGLAGSALLGSAVLERWPPNQDHPLIGGGQKSYIERERIPDWSLAVVHAAALGTIRYGLGGNDRVRYAHGYAMAVVLTQFSTSLVKGVVGRRRPNTDAAEALGKSTRSKSFFSGHVSTTFCLATYGMLYTRHRTDRLLFRAGVPALLYGGAIYTAWTRVAEHRHYPSDVVAGAVAGSTVAALVYRWYDGMDEGRGRVSVVPTPAGLYAVVRF